MKNAAEGAVLAVSFTRSGNCNPRRQTVARNWGRRLARIGGYGILVLLVLAALAHKVKSYAVIGNIDVLTTHGGDTITVIFFGVFFVADPEIANVNQLDYAG